MSNESLIAHVNGQYVPKDQVHPLVDLGNAVSLAFAVPVATMRVLVLASNQPAITSTLRPRDSGTHRAA